MICDYSVHLELEVASGETGEVERALLAGSRNAVQKVCNLSQLSQGNTPNRRIPIDKLSAVSQRKLARCVDQVTNRINSPARKRARHQLEVPLPYALPPPSMSTLPESPIRAGPRSEGSLTAENRASLWIGEELTDQRTPFAQHPATTAD